MRLPILIRVAFSIKAEEILRVKHLSSLCTFRRKNRKIEGVFKKPRRLHLVKASDGLEHCPVTGCEHPGFASKRGCRKHVKNEDAWYCYLDAKPTVCPSPLAIAEAKGKVCKFLAKGKVCKFLAILWMILLARFHTGLKAAVVGENFVNNQIIQSQEL